jgi:2-desacetyl-2-hydroxyethyl bacteriochlorophyllide A dehydrogenase
MRALQLTDVGHLEVVELPVPAAGPGEVLVDVLACGLCGTDRHIVRGEYPSRMPLVLGHEFGGRVRWSGSASPWSPGDLVSVDPNISCGDCADCRAGRVALCPERYALGVDIDGGLSEVVVVPETQLYAIADVDPAHLAFVEPLACCLRGLDLAELNGGESVAVVGGGVMGQLTVQLAARAGASRITLVTRQAAKRALAEQLGATDSCTPEQAGRLSRTFDVVFECAGATQTVTQAMYLARRGGSVILLGIPPEGQTIPVSPFTMVVDELRVQGSFLNPLTQARAADLVGSGALDLDPLISRVLSLDEVEGALVAAPSGGDIKYVVRPAEME